MGMPWAANVVEGARSVLRHPLRSALTAITSAVAIAVTVNVISLSYGMEEDIRRGVLRFGRRTIDVARMPFLGFDQKRPSFGDAQVAQTRALLKDFKPLIVPRRLAAAQMRGAVSDPHVPLVCVGAGYPRTLDVGMRSGRWWRPDEADVAVLDAALEKKLFPDGTSATGQSLEVRVQGRTITARIVGVLDDPLPYRELFETFDASQSVRTLSASLLSFRNAYMPLDTMVEVRDGVPQYSGISIVVGNEDELIAAHEKLRSVWKGGFDAPDEAVKSGIGVFVRRRWMSVLSGNARRGADAGNIVWILIVLVAAIMISTLHLISVRERYDELAIRRCEGARRRDVALQITTEGVLTSLAGGVLGLPIGYVGAAVLRQIVDFPFRFELRYAIVATGVAAVLGLIAAVIPARHVARLQPARVLTRRLR